MKNIFFLFWAVLLGLAFFSYKENAARLDYSNSLDFQTDGRGGMYYGGMELNQDAYPKVKDYIVQGDLDYEESFPDISYIMHYPQGFGEKADRTVHGFARQLLMEHLDIWGTPRDEFFSLRHAKPEVAAEYYKNLKEQLKNDADLRNRIQSDLGSRILPKFIGYTVTETAGAFSVNFRPWDAGGAHSNWTYRAITIDKATGRAISLHDLFNSPGSLERTEAWLNGTSNVGYFCDASSVAEPSSPERTNIELYSTGTLFGIGAGLSMERLIVLPQGLKVVFAPYEQASFAQGDVCVMIPLEDFARLGINKSYWEPSPEAQ